MRSVNVLAPDAPGYRVPRIEEVPPAPRKPSPLARQLVFAYAGSQGIMRIVGLGFLVVGVVLTTVMGWGLPVDLAIAVTGTRTTGKVLSARLDPSTRIMGQHPARVQYEYDVGGVTMRGEHTALMEPPAPGKPIVVDYASVKPGWSHMAGSLYAPLGLSGLFPLLFVALGAGILVFAVRANRREIRAFVHGRPVLARVTFRGLDPSTQMNGRSPFMIRWEFRIASGEVFEGSLTSMNLLALEPFGNEEQVVVLYDPADPRCSSLYVA